MSDTTANQLDHAARQAAATADGALAATRRAANGALDTLQDGVDQLRQDTPGALGRIAAQVDELTRRSIAQARQTSADLRDGVDRGTERTVGYIHDQPVKAMLIAAATGAALAALVGMLARSRHPR